MRQLYWRATGMQLERKNATHCTHIANTRLLFPTMTTHSTEHGRNSYDGSPEGVIEMISSLRKRLRIEFNFFAKK